MRKYFSLAAVAGILALVLFAYCSGKSAGSVNETDKVLARQADAYRKAANLYMSEANREKKRSDSLLKNLTKADSLVRDKGVSLIKATRAYNTLRDSVLKAPHSDTENSIIAAADSALASATSVIKAHEAKDVVQDSVIASQSRQIFSLREALDWRAEEISALNKRLALSTKRVRSARKDGLLLGIGATAFVVVVSQALK
jgi:chromatin segregation and condensation protein Rec8/ScpA/Scc1 (kleisin family)